MIPSRPSGPIFARDWKIQPRMMKVKVKVKVKVKGRSTRVPRVPGSQKEEVSLESFAANSCHQQTESMSSVTSAVSSTMEMNEPPSGITNLLDLSDEPPSTDSFDHAGVTLSVSSATPDSPSFGGGQRPKSADFDVQTHTLQCTSIKVLSQKRLLQLAVSQLRRRRPSRIHCLVALDHLLTSIHGRLPKRRPCDQPTNHPSK